MDKLHEEISAAFALTTLGEPSIGAQLGPQSIDLMQMQCRINMNTKLTLERSMGQRNATIVASQNQQRRDLIPPTAHNTRGPKRNFAQKLFDLLQTGLHSDVIRWLPGGKAFIVLDKRRFANEILPSYFKESQYTSFTRKLSRWKFTRVSRGPYMGAYYHKNFRSDNRTLCRLMSCNNSKLNTNEGAESSKSEDEVESIVKDSQKEGKEEKQCVNHQEGPHTREESHSPSSTLNILQNEMLNKVTALENSMNNTNQNILHIKKQLMQIRLRKAQLEEKKQILMMQEAEARRLKEIDRLRTAVNLSIQQAESNIITAAARALDRSNQQYPTIQCNTQERALYQPGSLQAPRHCSRQQDVSMAGNPLAFKRMQLLNANIHQMRHRNYQSTSKPTRSSRAFAA